MWCVRLIRIVNIFKPPITKWPGNVNKLEAIYLKIYTEDFSIHRNLCWYENNEKNGEQLLKHAKDNNLHVVFMHKDKQIVFSRRSRQELQEKWLLPNSRTVLPEVPNRHRPL